MNNMSDGHLQSMNYEFSSAAYALGALLLWRLAVSCAASGSVKNPFVFCIFFESHVISVLHEWLGA